MFRCMTTAGMAAGLIAGAAALAAPAHADTTTDDFLSALSSAGITNIDPGSAVELGQSICPLLADRSQNTADIASTVADRRAARWGRPRCSPASRSRSSARGAVQDLVTGQSPIPLPLLNNLGF